MVKPVGNQTALSTAVRGTLIKKNGAASHQSQCSTTHKKRIETGNCCPAFTAGRKLRQMCDRVSGTDHNN